MEDARVFGLRSRDIIDKAPLQVYYSALIFEPESSAVRRAFEKDMPSGISLVNQRQANDNMSLTNVSSCGRFVAKTIEHKSMEIWDVASAKRCRTLFCPLFHQPKKYLFSPHGNFVAGIFESECREATIRIPEMATGNICGSPFVPNKNVVDCLFSPDESLIAIV